MRKRVKALIQWIKHLPILGTILRWSQRTSLPGLSGVPVYNVVTFVIDELQKDDISTRANSIAFSFFLAIFPAIIFAFTLIPLLPYSEYYADLVNQSIESALPVAASSYLTEIIDSVASIKRGGLLSIGVLLSLFFASSGMLTLMHGFDKSYDNTFRKRSYLRKRMVALGLTVLLVILFIVSVVLIVIGYSALNVVLEVLGISIPVFILRVLRVILSFIVLYLGISTIFRYGPSMYRRTAIINAGAIVATVLSIFTSLAFSYFVNNFGRYNELYGSIGALIVILLWLQFNASILLIGFELNAGIAVNRDILYHIDD